MNVAVFFVLIAVCVLITPGKAAIECFQCEGPGCEDPYDGPDEHVVGNCTHCGKAIIDGIDVAEGTSRSCQSGVPEFIACKRGFDQENSGLLCFCDEDLCNSGSTITLALSALLSALALKYLL